MATQDIGATSGAAVSATGIATIEEALVQKKEEIIAKKEREELRVQRQEVMRQASAKELEQLSNSLINNGVVNSGDAALQPLSVPAKPGNIVR